MESSCPRIALHFTEALSCSKSSELDLSLPECDARLLLSPSRSDEASEGTVFTKPCGFDWLSASSFDGEVLNGRPSWCKTKSLMLLSWPDPWMFSDEADRTPSLGLDSDSLAVSRSGFVDDRLDSWVVSFGQLSSASGFHCPTSADSASCTASAASFAGAVSWCGLRTSLPNMSGMMVQVWASLLRQTVKDPAGIELEVTVATADTTAGCQMELCRSRTSTSSPSRKCRSSSSLGSLGSSDRRTAKLHSSGVNHLRFRTINNESLSWYVALQHRNLVFRMAHAISVVELLNVFGPSRLKVPFIDTKMDPAGSSMETRVMGLESTWHCAM